MILDRYIGQRILTASAMTLFTLTAVFSFFALVDQLGDTGRGDYGVMQAIQYVLLTIPRLSYELFPIATVIGSMTALGILANSSELTVIRTAGISQKRLAYSLLKIGVVFAVISILMGEMIVPIAEQNAKQKRSIALNQQIGMKSKYGFWLRDGNHYINIRKILPGNRIGEIYIYAFDEDRQLQSNIFAKHAAYNQGQWVLHDILKTEITEKQITNKRYATAEWDVLLDPEIISRVAIEPQYLSTYDLINYMGYLEVNNQNSKQYAQAFWSKIINPFAIMGMMLLSICVVRCEGRSMQLGQRIFMGALIGIVFHFVNQVSGYFGIIYGVSSFLSICLPTIVVLAYICYSLNPVFPKYYAYLTKKIAKP